MVMRFDPFRDLDRLAQQAFGGVVQVRSIPMDAYRRGDAVFVHFDLPGIDPNTIDLTVEQNVLSVTAERLYDRKEGDQIIAKERPVGAFERQMFLGEHLDPDGSRPATNKACSQSRYRLPRRPSRGGSRSAPAKEARSDR